MESTFGAGCFWGVEAAFRAISGVDETAVGYAGGDVHDPTYEQVCGGRSGHAEVVRVWFDPDVVAFDSLLRAFFGMHDSTQLNRQGPDIGTQYRSVIFFHDDAQERAARAAVAAIPGAVTQVESAGTFWRAEEYHQQYFAKNGGGHCGI